MRSLRPVTALPCSFGMAQNGPGTRGNSTQKTSISGSACSSNLPAPRMARRGASASPERPAFSQAAVMTNTAARRYGRVHRNCSRSSVASTRKKAMKRSTN